MLKLARRAKGHFVTLIEIRVHLIRCKPGHISLFLDGFSVECRKTNTKVITSTNHRRCKRSAMNQSKFTAIPTCSKRGKNRTCKSRLVFLFVG